MTEIAAHGVNHYRRSTYEMGEPGSQRELASLGSNWL